MTNSIRSRFAFAVTRYGQNPLGRFSFIAFLLLALSQMGPADVASAETACKKIEAPATLELKNMYSDAKGSVMNEGNELKNGQIMAPIFDFFRTLEHALDKPNARPGDAESDCAFALFGDWAEAGALTSEPATYEGQGKVKRGLLNPGFQMLGIKFRAAGYKLTPTMLTWLKTMDHENVDFYVKGSNRSNQRVWAAAGAALSNLLAPDPEADRFQEQVWHEAMAAIHDNGFIDGELARGQQALVYHLYSLSATLVLESARAALGAKETASDKKKIKLLEDGIGRTLCEPSEMEQLAQSKMRIPDGEWAYEVTNGFGGDRLEAEWSKCKPPAKDFNARDMGGDSRRSATILAQLAKNAR